MMRVLAVFFVAASIFFLNGCATAVQLANLEKGKSDTSDVTNLLGKPVSQSSYKDATIWEFQFNKVEKKNSGQTRPGQAQPQLILKIKFDDDVYDGFSVDVVEKTVQPMPQNSASRGQNTTRPHVQSGQGNSFFKDFDKDNDSRVSKQEFPGPAQIFDRLDRNHDGYIEADEAPSGKARQRVPR